VIVAVALVVASAGSGSHHRTRASSTRAVARHRFARTARRARPGGAIAADSRTYAVGLRSLTITEPAPSAIADATTSSGQPARVLPTTVRYPAPGSAGGAERPEAPAATAGAPFPLIVFSQGYDTPVSAYAGLLDAWTRAGYVVAAPTYPFTDPSAGRTDEADIVNHPADLRFVISALVSQADGPSTPLGHLVDTREIALAGQSDGGDVSLAVAANSCCQDAAVKAAVILSGAEYPGFGGAYYRSPSPPLLVTQGDQDTINLPGCSAALYDQAPARKYYVDLIGATHLPPYVDPGPPRSYVAKAVVNFLDYYLEGRRSGLDALLGARGIPGVASITTAPQLAGRSTYCP
jgi:dienelactone hydrolase